jgi:Predicted membrane protein
VEFVFCDNFHLHCYIFGQIEAGLAEPYSAAESTLNLHTILGWSLSGIIAAITAWRYVLRSRDPKTLPPSFLGVNILLTGIVFFQVYLGDVLVWVYGLHTVRVVEAVREGLL